jgi:hypothetical protein
MSRLERRPTLGAELPARVADIPVIPGPIFRHQKLPVRSPAIMTEIGPETAFLLRI